MMLEWYPIKHHTHTILHRLYISRRHAKRIGRSHTLALVILAKLALSAGYAHAVRIGESTDAGKKLGRSSL
jgi:hypothetical protein